MTKRDESFSPSLFTFSSHFAAIHHHSYYVFMTAHTALPEFFLTDGAW